MEGKKGEVSWELPHLQRKKFFVLFMQNWAGLEYFCICNMAARHFPKSIIHIWILLETESLCTLWEVLVHLSEPEGIHLTQLHQKWPNAEYHQCITSHQLFQSLPKDDLPSLTLFFYSKKYTKGLKACINTLLKCSLCHYNILVKRHKINPHPHPIPHAQNNTRLVYIPTHMCT